MRTAITGTRSVTAIATWSGQSRVTVAEDTCRIVSTRLVTAPALTRDSGVPSGTSAASITCEVETRWVPVTVTDRTTNTRSPSSSQATKATTATPANAKNLVRHRIRRRTRPGGAAAAAGGTSVAAPGPGAPPGALPGAAPGAGALPGAAPVMAWLPGTPRSRR